MTTLQIIGGCMLALPFIGFYIIAAKNEDEAFLMAVKMIYAVIAVGFFMFFGAYLLSGVAG